jgi:hypothetical protein
MRVRRFMVAVAASASILLLTPSIASADCHATKYPSGSGSLGVGPGTSYGSSYWASSTKFVNGFALGASMSGSNCETTAYDWATVSGHYDARMIRDCDNDSGGYSFDLNEPSSSRTLRGMQKWGVCYAPNGSNSGCTTSSQSESGCMITSMNFSFTTSNKTTRWWVHYSNGTYGYYSGGDVTSATS